MNILLSYAIVLLLVDGAEYPVKNIAGLVEKDITQSLKPAPLLYKNPNVLGRAFMGSFKNYHDPIFKMQNIEMRVAKRMVKFNSAGKAVGYVFKNKVIKDIDNVVFDVQKMQGEKGWERKL